MQKFSVSTSKGFIHTTDFKSALRVLEMDYEEKKRKLEEELKKKETQPKDWDKEFQTLLENYIPDNPQNTKEGNHVCESKRKYICEFRTSRRDNSL